MAYLLENSMRMRTRYALICPCGATGAIKLSGNDAPFSANYETYGVEGFDGRKYTVEPSAKSWTEVFQQLRPHCSSCGTYLTPEQLQT